jgi:hypothetical protein
VGDLPGNDSEVSVAKLPEERAHPDPYSESLATKVNQPEITTSATSNTLPPSGGAAAKDHLRKRLHTHGITHDGVGDLPGNYSEVSVAKLPEERAHPDPYSEYLAAKANQLEATHLSNLNTDNQGESSQSPADPTHPATSDQAHDGIKEPGPDSDSKKTDPTESAGSPSHHHHHHHLGILHHHHHLEGKGVDKTMGRIGTIGEKDGDSHFPPRADHAEPAPSSPERNTSGLPLLKTISGPMSVSKIEPGSNFNAGHRRSGSSSSTGKPSFMDIVKGEMKVISGKITGDEKKVEEGKALMSAGGSASLTESSS